NSRGEKIQGRIPPKVENTTSLVAVMAMVIASPDSAPSPIASRGPPSTWRGFASSRIGFLALQTPNVDLVEVKTPVAPDPECGQLTGLQEAIDRAWMNFQVLSKFLYGDYPRDTGRIPFHGFFLFF